MAELFDTTELMSVLRDLARDAEAGYKDLLKQHGHIASGALYNSISTDIEVNGTTYTVWMNMSDMWKYVEYDTKPHWPPKEAILNWIKIKPIIPRPDTTTGKIPTPETLAFLIGRAMAGKSPNQEYLKNPHGGTTGTHDFRTSRDGVVAFYEERLLEALHRDALNYIEKVLP